MRTLSMLLFLPVLLVVACGSDPLPTPGIDFTFDSAPLTNDGDLADGRLGDLGDLEHPDLSGDADAPDGDPDLAPDLLQICTPNLAFCQAAKVMLCNDAGTGHEVLDDCDDDNECTNDGCANAVCTHDPVAGSCCHPECELGELCVNGECICIPNCIGAECGDDGCGGSCGDCPEHHTCTPSGKCKCEPTCEGLECGDDGCGGSCGFCLEPAACEAGLCVCQPDCAGKSCGDDGCGGSCGECPALHQCQEGACQFYCPTCPTPANCSIAPFGPHAYFFCTYGKQWGDARDECKKFQSHLVTITSGEENSFLAANATGNTWWIGYSQDWYTWVWKWVTGEDNPVEYWGNDQPDNGGFWPPDEDCAEIKPNGQWNDQECNTDRFFICEFEPAS